MIAPRENKDKTGGNPTSQQGPRFSQPRPRKNTPLRTETIICYTMNSLGKSETL